MSLAGLRRLVPVDWDGDVPALVGLFAARHAFEASAAERAEIARRAAALLAAPKADADAVRDLTFDLLTADWKTRAEAARRLAGDGAWTPWDVVGSLAGEGESEGFVRDAARAASAILVAAREVLTPGTVERHDRLRGPVRAGLAHEQDGARLWDDAARPLASAFAANARRHGADRRAAALRALSAAAHLKGRALRAHEDAFLLGAAAATLLRPRPGMKASGMAMRLEALVRGVAALNAARAALWDGVDAESVRLLGAGAAVAAFGRGALAAPVPHATLPRLRGHLPPGALRLADLTASEAAAALDDEASDPRIDAARRRRLERLADALRRHPAAHAVTFAEAFDVEAPATRTAVPRPGMKLYRAVVRGRRRPLVCEGRNGRAVRCRAVAGDDGAVVGYLAYDALSREFGGRPLYAAYALDGTRYGYAWADERPVLRRGEPAQGFRTAPAAIPA